MATSCFTMCPGCSRHVRCGERACPFCGARVTSFIRVFEYRLKTRLNRGQGFSLGAALTAVGIATASNDIGCAVYGVPCDQANNCSQQSAGAAGWAGGAGAAGHAGAGGNATAIAGSHQGGNGGNAQGGNALGGSAGTGGQMTGNAGDANDTAGAAGEANGGASNDSGEEDGGSGGDGGHR